MCSTFYLCLLHRDVFFKLKRCAGHIWATSDIRFPFYICCDCFIVFVVIVNVNLCFVFIKLKRCAEHISANLDIGCKVAFWSFIATFPSLMCPNLCCSYMFQFCFCSSNNSILFLYFRYFNFVPIFQKSQLESSVWGRRLLSSQFVTS